MKFDVFKKHDAQTLAVLIKALKDESIEFDLQRAEGEDSTQIEILV